MVMMGNAGPQWVKRGPRQARLYSDASHTAAHPLERALLSSE